MVGRDVENPLVVMTTALMAISGVVAMRTLLGMDHLHWAVAYLAMGLTASIRRTSGGNDCSAWSALRGVACLLAGLYACQLMGYPVDSYRPSTWMPEDVAVAITRLH